MLDLNLIQVVCYLKNCFKIKEEKLFMLKRCRARQDVSSFVHEIKENNYYVRRVPRYVCLIMRFETHFVHNERGFSHLFIRRWMFKCIFERWFLFLFNLGSFRADWSPWSNWLAWKKGQQVFMFEDEQVQELP